MKQTAVDWLVDQIENYNCMKIGLIPSDIIEKAKEIGKEQIKEAHLNGQSEWDIKSLGDIQKKLSEEYYNQTYQQK